MDALTDWLSLMSALPASGDFALKDKYQGLLWLQTCVIDPNAKETPGQVPQEHSQKHLNS